MARFRPNGRGLPPRTAGHGLVMSDEQREPDDTSELLREAQQDKGYGEDEGEREPALEADDDDAGDATASP